MKSNTMLIGFIGKKGSGKSTAADYIKDNMNYVEKSFAECLKKACQNIFMLSDQQINGDLKEVPDPRWNGCTPRKMFQFIGTDLFRNQLNNIIPGIQKDVFVRHFELWYLNVVKKNENAKIVVTDIRFQNEADLIKKYDGTIIKIMKRDLELDLHKSETEMDAIKDYDYVIDNDGLLYEFYKKVSDIVHKLEQDKFNIDQNELFIDKMM